jgi:hypothetical protein
MKFQIPHKTTKIEAMTRIKKMLAENQQKIAEHAVIEKTLWNDNVLDFAFTAQGTHISGTVTVTDTEFDVYAKLPLMYRLFEGQIEKMIKAEVAKLNL